MLKKSILIVLLFTCITLSVLAEDSELFVRSVPIVKVYLYREGYKIDYMKNNFDIGSLYLPLNWFTGSGGKGELVMADDPSFPYFSVFWRGGEFSHIRLYLRNNLLHGSWGNPTNPDEVGGRFKDEPPEFQF